jgi:hypothetical protein
MRKRIALLLIAFAALSVHAQTSDQINLLLSNLPAGKDTGCGLQSQAMTREHSAVFRPKAIRRSRSNGAKERFRRSSCQ